MYFVIYKPNNVAKDGAYEITHKLCLFNLPRLFRLIKMANTLNYKWEIKNVFTRFSRKTSNLL